MVLPTPLLFLLSSCLLLIMLLSASVFSSARAEKSSDRESSSGTVAAGGDKSPFYQYLPNCSKKDYKVLKKNTHAKGILCPMIKDEEGFLSEWVAYYEMMGFNHIMIFDDGSVDNFKAEIQPWLKNGFVSIRSNWTADSLQVTYKIRKNKFKTAMATKHLLERECKLQAIQWGYDIFVSLDIDEYVLPINQDETVMDAIAGFMNKTERLSYCIDKLNFQQSPHSLEPINLLTIEAFQSRMKVPSKMSYYTSVAPKCSYALNGFGNTQIFTNYTEEFVATCCNFHGCQGHDLKEGKFCGDNWKAEGWKFGGKGKKWIHKAVINHYSRSLEKYALKMKTWTTATGETQINQTHEAATKGYDIPKFLARNLGTHHDSNALRYACQLRAHLAERTGEEKYLRPGSFWMRNPEYGRDVSDPDKRGRYGRPNAPGFRVEVSDYNYHGREQTRKAPIFK